MTRFKKTLMLAAVVLPLFSWAAFGQVSRPGATPPPPPPRQQQGNAIAAYVFGMENAKLGEDLADAIINNLTADRKYSAPHRGASGFFREVEREETRLGRRGRLLDDSDFCRIGRGYDVSFLTIIDIETRGRGNSVWARIIDLNTCRVVSTAEFTGIIRNDNDVRTAARDMSRDLLRMNVGRRSVGTAVVATPTPPPPPPRGNQIAAYVYGMEEARLGEELSEAIVNGLANSRTYSQPRRGARGFFQAADREQNKKRGRLLEDRDFCKIGTDYEIEYLVIIDIEKAGRGNSIWARILDLETCRIIATGESTALIRNDNDVRAVADEIVRELLHRKIGTRGRR